MKIKEISVKKIQSENCTGTTRAHRLAEKLIHHVSGGDFEKGAAEFEHVADPKLIDSLCTMLGHPRECPHGQPIPEGECCRRSKAFIDFEDVL